MYTEQNVSVKLFCSFPLSKYAPNSVFLMNPLVWTRSNGTLLHCRADRGMLTNGKAVHYMDSRGETHIKTYDQE